MGRGLIKALVCPGDGGSGSQNCPEGQGALTPCVSWGWRGLKTNVAHPSLRIISGTALSSVQGPALAATGADLDNKYQPVVPEPFQKEEN